TRKRSPGARLNPGRPSGPVSPKTLAARPLTSSTRVPAASRFGSGDCACSAAGKRGRTPAASVAETNSRREMVLLIIGSCLNSLGRKRLCNVVHLILFLLFAYREPGQASQEIGAGVPMPKQSSAARSPSLLLLISERRRLQPSPLNYNMYL